MSLSTSGPNNQPTVGVWNYITLYLVPPVAAAIATIPAFRDLVAKSAQQKGQSIPSMTLLQSLKGGIKAAPTVAVIVGTEMVVHPIVKKALGGKSETENLFHALASSAIVGIASAPFLAAFNGQTMGWSVRESLRRFSPRQGLAISIQETAFVAGLTAADPLGEVMKRKFGNNKIVEYSAAFIAGAAGSLAGHPPNTALTRWQSGMTLDSFRQSMWGSARKARAIGCFSVVYKFGKEIMSSAVHSSEK